VKASLKILRPKTLKAYFFSSVTQFTTTVVAIDRFAACSSFSFT